MRTKRKPARKPSPFRKKSTPQIDRRKRQELLGILLIILGVFILIALFSYNSNETPKTIDLHRIKNQLGFAGVYISYYLIRWTIGYPIGVLPFLIIAWGFNRLVDKRSANLLKTTILSLVFALFLSVSFALHGIISSKVPNFQVSGKIGGLGAQFLVMIFGQYGAVVVLIGLIMIAVLFSTTVSFSEIYQSVSAFLQRFFLEFSQVVSTLLARFSRNKQRRPGTGRPFRIGSGSRQAPDSWYNSQEQPSLTADKSQRIPIPTTRSGPAKQLDLNLESEKAENIENKDSETVPGPAGEYILPPLNLLQTPPPSTVSMSDQECAANAALLEEKLADFGLTTRVVNWDPGPVITRYELELAPGIKVSRVTSLADDLAMAMRAQRIRIVAPIPGKAAIGIEIPNPVPAIVYLQDILSSTAFRESKSPLTIGLGKTIAGEPFVTDLNTMPHLLVAGSTGSGKSVCLNTIITSILYKSKPSEVQIVLIDPKRLELSTYTKLYRHHLNYVDGQKEKVATNPKSATAILKSLEQEMENRYELLATAGVRNIAEYNERVEAKKVNSITGEPLKPLVYLVLIVDELADLMLTANATKDVEEPIARLTQMSRAVGIHLVLATQRPSVDVITGVIKANFPARIAFQVASKIDSRTILDMNGAEKLLGRGDMLFLPPARPEPIRIHNAFIDLKEIENVIGYIRKQPFADKTPLPSFVEEEESGGGLYSYEKGKRDPLFNSARDLVVRHQQGSVSLIQRRLKVGYSRAARLIDELEDEGIVGPFEGSKAREVLITPEELESRNFDEGGDDEM